ncbi:MAG: hypothetical protein AAGB22_11145 [Bacteroidota bacterium]
MPATLISADDLTFVKRIESARIRAGMFDHKGHLRLSWCYLMQSSFAEAHDRLYATIQFLDRTLMDGTKFHATVTTAFLRLLNDRLRESPDCDWPGFMERHPELFRPYKETLHAFYSPERLQSPEARKAFLSPDIAPLPAA